MNDRPLKPRDYEDISAFLDGEMKAGEKATFESRLQTEPGLFNALESMREARGIIRSRTLVKAPRNYTLSPQMVGMSAPISRSTERLIPIFQFSSLASAALFMILMVVNLLNPQGFFASGLASQAPVNPRTAFEATPAAEFDQAQNGTNALPTEAAMQKAAPPPSGSEVGGMGGGSVTDTVSLAPAPLMAPSSGTLMATPTLSGELALMAEAAVPTSTATTAPSATVEAYPLLTSQAATSPYPSFSQPVSANPAQPKGISWVWFEILLALIAIGSGILAIKLRQSKTR